MFKIWIWSPFYISHKATLEHVHKQLLKCLHLKVVGYYPERGLAFILIMIKFCASLSFLYKLLHGKIDYPIRSYQIPTLNSRNSELFYIYKSKTNIMLTSPINLIC